MHLHVLCITGVSNLDDNKKRWLVVGICLHTVVSPVLKKYIGPTLLRLYNALKMSDNSHTQVYPNVMKTHGANQIYVNY